MAGPPVTAWAWVCRAASGWSTISRSAPFPARALAWSSRVGSDAVRPHLSFPVGDPSHVGEARRAAVALAEVAGFGETDSGRVALVATELGTNLSRHAQMGSLLI